MMASVAARELVDGEVVFVGIGLPNLACNLARATHAPHLVLVYESGAVGAAPVRVPGAGPVKVITDRAVLEVDEATGELVLAALYPGVEASDVQAGVGWPLACRPRLARIVPPAATELRLLRDVLDPARLYLKG